MSRRVIAAAGRPSSIDTQVGGVECRARRAVVPRVYIQPAGDFSSTMPTHRYAARAASTSRAGYKRSACTHGSCAVCVRVPPHTLPARCRSSSFSLSHCLSLAHTHTPARSTRSWTKLPSAVIILCIAILFQSFLPLSLSIPAHVAGQTASSPSVRLRRRGGRYHKYLF